MDVNKLKKIKERQDQNKTDEEREIEKIMNDKKVDLEVAWRIYQERKEIKKLPDLKKTVKKEEKPKMNLTLQDIYDTVEKYLYITDRNRIDLILATALSNQIKGTPIWLIIVGNSGDWKSAFTRSLEGLHNCIKVDQMTRNTLASGAKDKKGNDVPDLGQDLVKRSTILLIPDLASMTSMNTDEKNAIWGQFRNLYDGFINKKTGSGVMRKYEDCHVTLIACTTPSIRDEILIHSQLGTRELMYDTNPDMVDNDMKMDKAWDNEEFEEQMKNDITKTVCDFLFYKKIKKIDIPNEIKEFLKKEADRLSVLRAGGMVDKIHKELINPVAPEIPTRVIKQFKRIYVSLKSLDENYPDEKIRDIINHIVNSSGNIVRRLVLDALFGSREDVTDHKWCKIKEIQHITRLGRKTVKSQLEQLWNMNIIEKKVVEERIGGYVYEDGGYENVRGGRIEDIAYYRFNGLSIHIPTKNEWGNS